LLTFSTIKVKSITGFERKLNLKEENKGGSGFIKSAEKGKKSDESNKQEIKSEFLLCFLFG
jgi:hypothetical protein